MAATSLFNGIACLPPTNQISINIPMPTSQSFHALRLSKNHMRDIHEYSQVPHMTNSITTPTRRENFYQIFSNVEQWSFSPYIHPFAVLLRWKHVTVGPTLHSYKLLGRRVKPTNQGDLNTACLSAYLLINHWDDPGAIVWHFFYVQNKAYMTYYCLWTVGTLEPWVMIISDISRKIYLLGVFFFQTHPKHRVTPPPQTRDVKVWCAVANHFPNSSSKSAQLWWPTILAQWRLPHNNIIMH